MLGVFASDTNTIASVFQAPLNLAQFAINVYVAPKGCVSLKAAARHCGTLVSRDAAPGGVCLRERQSQEAEE